MTKIERIKGNIDNFKKSKSDNEHYIDIGLGSDVPNIWAVVDYDSSDYGYRTPHQIPKRYRER